MSGKSGIFEAAAKFFKNIAKDTARSGAKSGARSNITRQLRRDLERAGQPGREALRTIEQNGTTVVFKQGGGSFYTHAANTITIDTTNGNPIVGLVHEATHVRWAHGGHTANVALHGRTEYVNRMLREETDGTVNQIRANIELQRQGINVPDTTLQKEYIQGYHQAVHQANAQAYYQGRTLTSAEQNHAGHMGGAGAVNSAFHSGHIRTSNTNAPYPNYYADAWDQYHNWLKQQGGQHP